MIRKYNNLNSMKWKENKEEDVCWEFYEGEVVWERKGGNWDGSKEGNINLWLVYIF